MLNPSNEHSEKITNPQQALANVFDSYQPSEIQKELWNCFRTALTSEEAYTRPIDRSNLLFFYEKLLKLTEAAWLIHQQNTLFQ